MTQQDIIAKFDKFLSDNEGKFIERVDPSNLDQCFDLAVYWCEYLGLPKNIFNGLIYAKQIWIPSTNLAVQNFDYIDNTPDGIPHKGDVVVLSGGYNGGAGHVGMATGKGDVWTFEMFEQNDPVYSNSHRRIYDYGYVLGWLRFKTTSTPNADTQVKLASDAIQSALNATVTGSQMNDPAFKTKMAQVKSKAQQIVNLL